jgi:cytochrome P450
MQLGFSPRLVKSYEDSIIRPVIARRFAEIKGKGRADLVRELNAFYPYEIIGSIVGFDPADVGFVADCFTKIFRVNVDRDTAAEAGVALRAYSRRLIEARRAQPKDDIVSGMLEAEVDGEAIDEEHLIAMVNHLMAGGIDTTYKQTGNTVHLLLEHPDQFELLRKDRDLIPRFVDEALRYEGIGGIIARQAAEDTNLQGTDIPRGGIVFIMHPVVNRDPARWADPDVLNVLRETKAQMQFSNGAHSCIGQHIARFMLATYISHLITALPGLRWDPEKPRPRITGWTQRTPLSLPVVWDAPG